MSRSPPTLSPPLAALHNVSLTISGRPVLRRINWVVRRGDGWLVTGPNGSGKTSLLRLLTGRLWPDSAPRGGSRLYAFAGGPTSSPISIHPCVSWLGPEIHQRFARLDVPLRVGDVILTGFARTLLLTHRPTPAQCAAARLIASQLGLLSQWRRLFAELSQGRQRLVLLARALAPAPTLLVLDEFSDNLDDTTRPLAAAAIATHLRRDSAVVLATHRATDLLPGLTRHLAMNQGRAREAPLPSPKKNGDSATLKPPPASRHSLPPTLRLLRASVAIGDHHKVRRILHRLSWTVRPGEHWAILGANASGKSTLLRAIYGDLPVAHGGSLERFGLGPRHLPLPAARRHMGFISPALHHAYEADASVDEVVASGFQASIGLHRPPTRAEMTAARATLRQFRLHSLAQRRWGALSFGETRLALLARAVVHSPRLLLLDEPCDGLAPAARSQFLRYIERLARFGVQIIVAAHHRDDLPRCVNQILRLANGRMAPH